MSENLPPKQPVEIEGRNFRRAYRERQAGKLYLIQMEVTKEQWDAFETIPSDALIGGVIWHHDGDMSEPPPVVTEKPKRAKQEKLAKGSYGFYWAEMFARGFWAFRNFQHDLGFVNGDANAEKIKEKIKQLFLVESLTLLSPAQFEEWLATRGYLGSLITMSRQCAARVGL